MNDPASPEGPHAAPRRAPGQRADWYKKTSAASVGIEMAVAICGGAIGGMYLERHFTHWAPWTTLIGLFIGIGAAALAIVRVIREHDTEMAARRAEGLGPDGLPLPVDAPRSVDHALAGPAKFAEPAGDAQEARELAQLRRRQRARPLDERGPLP